MTAMTDTVWIIKTNPQGEETWRYQGTILDRTQHSILVEAFFNRSDILFHGVEFKENDLFLERYYQNRWYNIFEIHDRDDDHLKGWYCNITLPATFAPDRITYADLALDLLVYPDGNHLVLDRDEFDALEIKPEIRQAAKKALGELIDMAEKQQLGVAIKPNRRRG